jgi:serine/threonine-protein kinase
VYDIGKHDGLPYFSLEFVDGKPLDKDLEGKPQPEKRAAELLETLARAMHYAHERSIIHRDLKPANVLLTKTGVPKISDFGLAKQLESDSSQTKTGTIMGTPSYMAPEQGRGEKQIGHLADVYALGSMLYELITGRPPFLAATALKTLMRLLNEEPVPPSRVQPGVSRDLETICMKCLQKDPARRYETAAVLAEDLRRFQNGEAILARRVSRAERAWRWCKRNPRTTALSGAVAVLLVAVCVTLSLMALRMSRDRAAVAETRKQAEERWQQATAAVSSGGFGRARDLLMWSDPLMSTAPDLADVREKLDVLRTQITALKEFRELLDRVRYLGLFGGAITPEAQSASHELIALYDQVEKHQEVGRHGWPPLNPHQQQLLQEDIFEAYLVSSIVERSAVLNSGDQMQLVGATRLSIDWLNRAEKVLPPTKALFVWRGGYQEKLGDNEAAKADFERAKQIEPTSAVDRFWHAFADYRRAEDALENKDNKSAGNFYRLAAIGFAKVIEVRPENFWAHFSWANCLPKLGDGYGAVVGYTACIQIRPDVPWPYKNRGTIHFQLGERDLALADFDKAVALGPEDATILALRGDYFSALKDFAKAKADYSAALQLQPSNMQVRRSRAVVSLLSKDFEDSLADWQELAKRLPQNYEPHLRIATIYLGQQSFAPALAELQIALERKPDEPNALLARATIRRWQGQTEEAFADINLVVDKLVPDRHDYLIERADLLRALGRDAEAIQDYQRCVTLQPKQTDGYLGLACVYERQGTLVRARDCYDRMIKADPTVPVVYLHRAEFLRSQGDYDAAIADCDLAAKIDPKSPLPKLVRAGIIAAQGNPVEAAKETEQQLADAPPHDGKVLYAAACALSLAAQAAQAQPGDAAMVQTAQAYAKRAAELLADVVGACFHDFEYPEHNRMAWNPALAAIRTLPQVEKLLAGRK